MVLHIASKFWLPVAFVGKSAYDLYTHEKMKVAIQDLKYRVRKLEIDPEEKSCRIDQLKKDCEYFMQAVMEEKQKLDKNVNDQSHATNVISTFVFLDVLLRIMKAFGL